MIKTIIGNTLRRFRCGELSLPAVRRRRRGQGVVMLDHASVRRQGSSGEVWHPTGRFGGLSGRLVGDALIQRRRAGQRIGSMQASRNVLASPGMIAGGMQESLTR